MSMISFISSVDKIISSKTGTAPAEHPVFPPCVHNANLLALQYLTIFVTSSVVFGFKTTVLDPKIGYLGYLR